METCLRGFSFMVENKSDLKYIEDDELVRTWRSKRRERMKKREQSIWDNFVNEQDAVKSVCSDNPYQFLEPLPDTCMTEMMEDGQPKSSREIAEEEARAKREHEKEQAQQISSPGEDVQHTCVVTFADDMDKDDCEMFHIFDDEQSGEDEPLNDDDPDTVREMPPESATDSAIAMAADQSQEGHIELQKSSSKSSENVASVIESSIYCARVQELRLKINEELLDLMTSLDRREILLTSEPEDIARMVKRSEEFCNRFNRIYMYQLQRQIHDIKRNNSQTLPFAKHTQFQSQMGRIVTLHQNLLQSFMVFHKSFSQTCCVRKSAGALGSLLAAVRDSTHMCLGVPPPKDFSACLDLYKDDLLSTCDKVDDFVSEYAIRCEEFLNRFEAETYASPKKSKKETKTKKKPWNNRILPVTFKSCTKSQLSMYSNMNTPHVHLNNANSSSNHKAGQLGKKNRWVSNPSPDEPSEKTFHETSSKNRIGAATSTTSNTYRNDGPADKNATSTKNLRRSRRPLMRDPHAGRPRAPKPTRDNDIRTMVECVETCTSSHVMSCEEDPPTSPRDSKRCTPRVAPRPPPSTARSPLPAARPPLPAARPPPPAARPARVPPARIAAPGQLSLRFNTLDSVQKKTRYISPRNAKKSDEPSPTNPRRQAASLKPAEALNESPSTTKQEQETEEQDVIPVLMVKCAMKQELKEEEVNQEPSEIESPNERMKYFDAAQLQVVYKYGECTTTVQEYNSPSRSSIRSRMSLPTKILQRELAMERAQELNRGSPDRIEVTRLLKQLCSGDGSSTRTERVSGNKNVQLLHINVSSPRPPSTPELLRILEETIKKKVPKPLFHKPAQPRASERYRLQFNIDEQAADTLFQYRTKFVQHMLTSAMYANSAVGKPWEMIGNVSEQIIDDVLLSCVSKMELREMIQELYNKETC